MGHRMKNSFIFALDTIKKEKSLLTHAVSITKQRELNVKRCIITHHARCSLTLGSQSPLVLRNGSEKLFSSGVKCLICDLMS